MPDLAIKNARIVLADEVIRGSLGATDGTISGLDHGGLVSGEDFDGDFLIPGLVELHTDHYENHYRPRPGVTWNADAALFAHDAQVAGAGITTVFDAVRAGSEPNADLTEDLAAQVGAIEIAAAEDRLRAQHFVHLRCELPTHDCYDHFAVHSVRPVVRLASVMDHTPGARQFTDLGQYIAYYRSRLRLDDDGMRRFVDERLKAHEKYAAENKAAVLSRGHELGLAFASHDDATTEQVEEALRDGVVIAEFPTTATAAAAAHAGGLAVLMGAPNLVRGMSHNGNVSTEELARSGVLDVLSSDYVPLSLLHAAFALPERVEAIDLPAAMRTVTANPARAAGLEDRGEIAVGKRADFVRVRLVSGMPAVRGVWRQGVRVS